MQKWRPKQLNLGTKLGRNGFVIRRVDLEKCFPNWGCTLKSDTRAKSYGRLTISHADCKIMQTKQNFRFNFTKSYFFRNSNAELATSECQVQ